MSETYQPITQKQDSLIREGNQVFRVLSAWMTAARNPKHPRVALFEALELFILILTWTKIKVRELSHIMFVLEKFLPAHKILNLK